MWVIVFDRATGFYPTELIYGPFDTEQAAKSWAYSVAKLTTREWKAVLVEKPR